MPYYQSDVSVAPANSRGLTTAAQFGTPVHQPGGVVPAQAVVPWVDAKKMCVRFTHAGAPCKNVATVGDVCAGHHKAVLAEQRQVVEEPEVEILEPVVPQARPVMRPITDERGFLVLLSVLGFEE